MVVAVFFPVMKSECEEESEVTFAKKRPNIFT